MALQRQQLKYVCEGVCVRVGWTLSSLIRASGIKKSSLFLLSLALKSADPSVCMCVCQRES